MTGTTSTRSCATSSGAADDGTAAARAAVRELLLHASVPDGFVLLFVFGDDRTLLREARDQLRLELAARVRPLEVIGPETTEGAAAAALEALLHRPRARGEGCWLELDRDAGAAAWDRARDELLVRLNEKREPLRRALQGALVIALPAGYGPRVRELAPDLWAVRAYSTRLATPGPRAREAQAEPEQDRSRVPGERAREPTAATRALWDEWQRLPRNAERRHLLLSQRLLEALEADGDSAGRAEVAEQALALARTLRQQLGDSPQVLRDLSVSLEKVGDAARARGDLERAREAFDESLALRRRLAAVFHGAGDAAAAADLEARLEALERR